MPLTDSGLPFSGSEPLSRHTSLSGAEAAEKRAPSQLLRLICLLLDHPEGLTDHELQQRLEIPLASVCARRGQLVEQGLVKAGGWTVSPVDPTAKNVKWIWAWERRK